MGRTAEQEVDCSNLTGEHADSDIDESKQLIHFNFEGREREKEYNIDYWKLEPMVGVKNSIQFFSVA
jgi:hypothetical protein